MGFVDTAKIISQKIGSLIQVNSVKKLTKRIKGLKKIMSFAGSQSGAFANTIASDLRKK